MNETPLTVNDLFCGAGGMGLGFKQAGFTLEGSWDFDKYAVESYRTNVSQKVKQADITRMNWNDLPKADVWTFGFPCQDISIAGRQAGMIKGQTRSGLFYEVMRLLKETTRHQPDRLPKVILAENVKAVKQLLPEIEREYKAHGYTMYHTLYNSKHWGVPQNRERYFIVGIHDSINTPFQFPVEQTHILPHLSTVLEATVDDKYYINSEKNQTLLNQFNQTAVPSNEGTRPKLIPITVSKQATEFRNIVSQSHCLLARDYKGFGNQEMNAVIDGERIRKLTPKEYARLQGFPDDYQQVVSNTQFYKQMGNAVSVPVSAAIANQIAAFLRDAVSPLPTEAVHT